MPSRGRERGLLSSPTAAAGGRWVGSEGAGVTFMLRNRGPQKKKSAQQKAKGKRPASSVPAVYPSSRVLYPGVTGFQ